MGPRLSFRPRGSRPPVTGSAIAAAAATPPRVNLLPRIEIERRERAALIRRWGWTLVSALAAVLVLSGASYALTVAAEQRLTAAQSRTTDLLAQLATLQKVSRALTAEAELTAFRTEAMATDLRFTDAITAVAGALPAGVSLTGFDLTVGEAPLAPVDDAASPEPGLEGSLTLDSATPVDMAPAVRAVRGLPGTISADALEISSQPGEGGSRTYTYRLSLVLDQTYYTDAYAAGDAEAAR